MSNIGAVISRREGLPSSDRTEGVSLSRKSPYGIRAFFHHLRVMLQPPSFSRNKSHGQHGASQKATSSRRPNLKDKSASASKAPVTSALLRNRKGSLSQSLSHFPSPPTSHRRATRLDGLNGVETSPVVGRRTRSVSRSPIKLLLPDKQMPTNSRGPPLEHSKKNEEPHETDEREKTLRILESKDRPAMHRPCSPGTIRRRRRSYQLATDPHIEPQQYSDFMRFLEQEITTDIALRIQIWKSLTGDPGDGIASQINQGRTERLPSLGNSPHAHMCVQRQSLNNYDKSHKLGNSSHRRPKSCTSIDYSTNLQDGKLKGGRWDRYQQLSGQKLDLVTEEEKENLRMYDPSIRLEGNKTHGRRRSVIDTGFDHSQFVDPGKKASLQRSNVQERQRWSQQGIPPKKYSDKRRESAPSFTHVIAQYIKPEMPRTIYKETQCRSYVLP